MQKKSLQISRGESCVYVLKLKGKLSYCKIGKSSDFEQRYNTIQSYNPFDLDILAVKKTKFHDYIEKILHFEFKSKKIKGEWFDLSKQDILNLKDLMSKLDSIEYLQANYKKIYDEMVNCGEIKGVPCWEDINPARDRNKNSKYNQSDIHLIREILHLERQKL